MDQLYHEYYSVVTRLHTPGIDIIIKNKTILYLCHSIWNLSHTEAVFAHVLGLSGTQLVVGQGQRVLVMKKWQDTFFSSGRASVLEDIYKAWSFLQRILDSTLLVRGFCVNSRNGCVSNFNSSGADIYFGKTGSYCEWLQLPLGWVRIEIFHVSQLVGKILLNFYLAVI